MLALGVILLGLLALLVVIGLFTNTLDFVKPQGRAIINGLNAIIAGSWLK